VSAVGQNGDVAKRIQKALDHRHSLALNRFREAAATSDLLRQWNEAMNGKDIPGAYWALLTHPLTTDELAKRAFGDLHMLSHLLGAANRADIHKLRLLEEQKTVLEEKLSRQQDKLREAIAGRDARIRELSDTLSARIERENEVTGREADCPLEHSALDRLIADLRKQLDCESRRRERAEQRLVELTEARAADARARMTSEREARELSEELAAVEASLAVLVHDHGAQIACDTDLSSWTILYVGGRPHQVARLRALVERASGKFVHHDGGLEERDSLLAGLVRRAHIAAFPVDCISHSAAQSLKQLCRQAGKPFLPLRSSSMASLLQGLRSTGLLPESELGEER
jgi:hypothetical protein